jgi:hypothetical protein
VLCSLARSALTFSLMDPSFPAITASKMSPVGVPDLSFFLIRCKHVCKHVTISAEHSGSTGTQRINCPRIPVFSLNSSTKKDREASLALDAGTESSVLGGVCSNETDFTGSLKRYLREILADVVHKKNMVDQSQTLWAEESLGVTSRHRRMRTYEIETDGVLDESAGSPKHGIEYDSCLSPRDYALAQRSLMGNASQVFLSTQSLSLLMDHMENLGHASAPYVEGLTVELLPISVADGTVGFRARADSRRRSGISVDQASYNEHYS